MTSKTETGACLWCGKPNSPMTYFSPYKVEYSLNSSGLMVGSAWAECKVFRCYDCRPAEKEDDEDDSQN